MSGYLVRVSEYGSPCRVLRRFVSEPAAHDYALDLIHVVDQDGQRRFDVVDILHRTQIVMRWEGGERQERAS